MSYTQEAAVSDSAGAAAASGAAAGGAAASVGAASAAAGTASAGAAAAASAGTVVATASSFACALSSPASSSFVSFSSFFSSFFSFFSSLGLASFLAAGEAAGDAPFLPWTYVHAHQHYTSVHDTRMPDTRACMDATRKQLGCTHVSYPSRHDSFLGICRLLFLIQYLLKLLGLIPIQRLS